MNHQALRKLHSFTGLVPLGAYLGFHAWEHWPVRRGRDAALAHLADTRSVPLELLLVLLPLLAHAGLGLWLARQTDPATPAPYVTPAFRRFQASTGLLSAAFLLWHVSGVWLPRALTGRPAEAYGALLDQVGTLGGAALYVVGTSAVCVHFGQGLSAAWIRFRPGVSTRLARSIGTALGLALWLVLFNELAVYATGAALM
jgi:succinate dehydrogenase / fumarate reductase cytochrome b subunit